MWGFGGCFFFFIKSSDHGKGFFFFFFFFFFFVSRLGDSNRQDSLSASPMYFLTRFALDNQSKPARQLSSTFASRRHGVDGRLYLGSHTQLCVAIQVFFAGNDYPGHATHTSNYPVETCRPPMYLSLIHI
eukprot:TRINITY_DN16490_c0_g1_i3.p4 TRINITY_DN16490_c0_g1~~TRINITY_DN16490_c0_g1_i3.p4  ORF type:complete len:130 (+),score=22.67 TRINITY_DN16490_c0_g1_i3:111-500(+)